MSTALSKPASSTCIFTLVQDSTMFSMWDDHLPLLANVTPRCLWEEFAVNWILLKLRVGGWLLQKYNTSVLAGLKVTSHCFDHWFIILRSWFRSSSKSLTLAVVQARDMSSANSLEMLTRFSVMLLTKMRKNKGPSTEPWGTPADILLKLEQTLPTRIYCWRSLSYLLG